MLDSEQRETLLNVAEHSIRNGLDHGAPLAVTPEAFAASLCEPGACFVTLHRRKQLRGCIGSLEAHRALVEDVAENAFAAAFRDPRFPPLGSSEWADLDIEVSVLGPARPMSVSSEADLLQQLQPQRDGLVLEESGRRATFLPAVWESLPDPEAFVQHLKLKAGLPPDYWSETLRFSRYRTESFGRAVQQDAFV